MRSFMRQLNQYGFERCWNAGGEHEYKHPGFAQGRPELLSAIARRREPKGLRIAPPGSRALAFTEERHHAGGHQRLVSTGAAGSTAKLNAHGSQGRAYSFENNFEALFPESNAGTASAVAETAALVQPKEDFWSTFDEDCEEKIPRASTITVAVAPLLTTLRENGSTWAPPSTSSYNDASDDDSNHDDDSKDNTYAEKVSPRGAMLISADELDGEKNMPMPLDYMREALKTSEVRACGCYLYS
jgi:hypothetical protein